MRDDVRQCQNRLSDWPSNSQMIERIDYIRNEGDKSEKQMNGFAWDSHEIEKCCQHHSGLIKAVRASGARLIVCYSRFDWRVAHDRAARKNWIKTFTLATQVAAPAPRRRTDDSTIFAHYHRRRARERVRSRVCVCVCGHIRLYVCGEILCSIYLWHNVLEHNKIRKSVELSEDKVWTKCWGKYYWNVTNSWDGERDEQWV